jgi:peptide methionine sulfoxide reductase msrA/msrB
MIKKTKRSILYLLLMIGISFISFVAYNSYQRSHSKTYMIDQNILENKNYEKVVFAGGCFWCTEAEFNHATGVISAVSGYADSEKESPSYEEVGGGEVKAREAVQIIFDPALVSFESLLEKYWSHIDPTDTKGQFGDRGEQYTTAIYYTNENQKVAAEKTKEKINTSKKFDSPVATLILPFTNFYPAEEYHQDYKDKNPFRYSGYREASGRNSFIRLHWQDGSTTTREIFPDSSSSTIKFSAETKAEKLKSLSGIQYKVTQEEGTEPPFENEYNSNKEVGIYVDIVSGEALYLSSDKYDSGTGWPSFSKPVDDDAVTLKTDNYLIYSRTEVRSKLADSHLGHVFSDGPKDKGGKRYCMNSAAMRFVKLADMEKEGYGEYVKLLK